MTALTLFGQANLGIGANTSTARLTIGTEFEVSGPAPLTGIWWFSPSGAAGLPSACAIFDIGAGTIVAGTLNSSPSWSGAAASGWVKCTYDGSISLVSGKKYQAAVYCDGTVSANWFSSVAGYWTTGAGSAGITNGILSAPNNATSAGGQDMVQSGGLTITLPNISQSGKNHGVDVEVSPVTSVSGSDTGSGADSGSVGVTGTDTGSGADSGSVGVAGTDSSTGADSATVTILAGDSGTGTDSATVGVSGADTGSGADSGSLTASVAGSDAGTGADAGSVSAAAQGSDAGTGADTAAVTVSVAAADTGSGADNASASQPPPPAPPGPAVPRLPLRPTNELVAVAWIGSIAGLSPQMVATTLPADTDANDDIAWWVANGLGFVTVSVVGGSPDPMLPVRKPVIQVDCWATKAGSNKPPWNVANRLAETIILAGLDRVTVARPLRISARGVTYPNACVQAAYAITEPRRIYDDAGDYARYSTDMQFCWIAVADVLT